MPAHLTQHASNRLVELMRLERQAFAAKLRVMRALIGWSQTELAQRAGLTQRSVHKLEQGDTEPRRATVRVIEALWRQQGVEFEDLADGGFRLRARPELFSDSAAAQAGQTQALSGRISGDH
jgi:transcriptional regulator with XRE-family HTH domain